MMHRSKMKDQVLVIKTNGKYYWTAREERCYGYRDHLLHLLYHDKYEPQISSP